MSHKTTPYENHPLANLFPTIPKGEHLLALGHDIKVNGLREPIVLYEGKVLDGRHRLEACHSVNVTPQFKQYEGDDPLGFVLSLNLHRRHLTKSQRAMIAANLADMKRGGDRRSDQSANLRFETSQATAADKLQVSERSVEQAAAVRKHGTPELQNAVNNGVTPIHAAAAVAKLPEDEQRAAVANGAEGIKAAAKGKSQSPSVQADAHNARIKLSATLSAETMQAIHSGAIRITDAELIELATCWTGAALNQAINLMHTNGWPLKRALRVIRQPIDEETRVKELLNLCIGAGGKWSGLFNLDAFRITVEHIKPELLKR